MLPVSILVSLAPMDGGDGEWMRDWQARMANAGAHVVGGEGVIARESPDEDALNQCRELGEALAAAEA